MEPLDQELFERHIMNSRSRLEVLMRGHLWIEFALNVLLDEATAERDATGLDDMRFAQKVRIAAAFDLLNPDLIGCVSTLNRLRNKLAHNLRWEPSDADAESLIAPLNGPGRLAYDAAIGDMLEEDSRRPDSDPSLEKMKAVVMVCVMLIGVTAMHTEYRREYRIPLIRVAARSLSGRHTQDELLRQEGVPMPPDPGEVWSHRGGPIDPTSEVAPPDG